MLLRDEEGVRWLPVSCVAVAILAVGYFAYQRWWPTDTTTQVSVEEVLEDFRAQQSLPPPSSSAAPSTPPGTTPTTTTADTAPVTQAAATATPTTAAPEPAPALPAPGVYRYATEGREHVDALGGTEHVYPPETTITVVSDGCGVKLRWDFLAERYEEWHLCLDGDRIVLAPDGVQFHQFFGQSQTDVAECRQAVVLVPPPEPGTATARDCTLAGEPWHPVWTFVERGTADVGGTDVATVTFAAAIELDDPDYWEHTEIIWTLAPSGLPVAADWNATSRNPSPVGGVVYTETFTAELLSLEPLR